MDGYEVTDDPARIDAQFDFKPLAAPDRMMEVLKPDVYKAR